MKKIFPNIILFLVFIGSLSFAQEQSYTLPLLLEHALENNSDILISKGDGLIFNSNRKKALSGILPEINLEGSYIYSSEKNGIPVFAGANGKNEILAFLSLRQTIFDPSRISDLRTSAVEEDEQIIRFEETKQNVISQVIEQYFTTLKYNNEKTIYAKNLEAFKLMYSQSLLLYESGSVPEIDVKKSKVELLLQKYSLNQAQKNYKSSLNQLKEIVGLKLNNKLTLKPFDISRVILDSLSHYMNEAWHNRPDWQILNKELELSKIKKSQAFMNHLPTISGNIYYGWDATSKLRKNNLGLQAVVSASVPLRHWGAISAEHQIAEIKTQQVDYRIYRLKLKILREIETNYNEALLQKEQITAIKESISEAKLAVKMANTGYKEGIITNLDLINTQKLYTQTEVEYLKALYNFYLAKVNLFKSIGKLKEDLSWIEE